MASSSSRLLLLLDDDVASIPPAGPVEDETLVAKAGKRPRSPKIEAGDDKAGLGDWAEDGRLSQLLAAIDDGRESGCGAAMRRSDGSGGALTGGAAGRRRVISFDDDPEPRPAASSKRPPPAAPRRRAVPVGAAAPQAFSVFDIPTVADTTTLTEAQLVAELQARRLPVDGRRAVLLDRLEAALTAEQHIAAATHPSAPTTVTGLLPRASLIPRPAATRIAATAHRIRRPQRSKADASDFIASLVDGL